MMANLAITEKDILTRTTPAWRPMLSQRERVRRVAEPQSQPRVKRVEKPARRESGLANWWKVWGMRSKPESQPMDVGE